MTTHVMPATGTVPSFSRPARHSAGRSGLAIAAALYLAVLTAEAAFIVHAAPSLPDIGSYYAIVP